VWNGVVEQYGVCDGRNMVDQTVVLCTWLDGFFMRYVAIILSWWSGGTEWRCKSLLSVPMQDEHPYVPPTDSPALILLFLLTPHFHRWWSGVPCGAPTVMQKLKAEVVSQHRIQVNLGSFGKHSTSPLWRPWQSQSGRKQIFMNLVHFTPQHVKFITRIIRILESGWVNFIG